MGRAAASRRQLVPLGAWDVTGEPSACAQNGEDCVIHARGGASKRRSASARKARPAGDVTASFHARAVRR
jgi:hypothetical protein